MDNNQFEGLLRFVPGKGKIMTMSIISRWMTRLGITGLYFGRSVPQCPSGSLVVFPYDPQTLSCGITALVAFKRTAPSDGSLQALHRTLDDIAACTWDKLKAQELDPVAHYLGGPELLGRLRALGARLKEQAPFYEVYADRTCQQQLSALAQRLADLVHAEDRIRLEQTGREAPPLGR
jgi:glucosamine--fructose-6-phosphate aminotransferase (isomerizing)